MKRSPSIWRLVLATAIVALTRRMNAAACNLVALGEAELRAPKGYIPPPSVPYRKLTHADVARIYQDKVRGNRP